MRTEELPLKNATVMFPVINAYLGLEEYLSLTGYHYFSGEFSARGFLRKVLSHCWNYNNV